MKPKNKSKVSDKIPKVKNLIVVVTASVYCPESRMYVTVSPANYIRIQKEMKLTEKK